VPSGDPRRLRNVRYLVAVTLGVLGVGAFLLLRAFAAGAATQAWIALAAIVSAAVSMITTTRQAGK
jgi:hypothetical protein